MARRKTDSIKTDGETLALFIARLFPESFTVFGERIAVRNDAGTEAARQTARRAVAEVEQRKNDAKKKSKR